MELVPYFFLVTVTQLVAGTLVTGPRAQRLFAVLVAALALGIPRIVPPVPWARAAIALGLVMTFLRTIDLARERKTRSLAFRILHVAIPFDTRRVHPSPTARASLHEVPKILLYFALTVLAVALVKAAGPFDPGATRALALRWSAGLVLAYAVTEVAYRGIEEVIRALGFDVYAFHRTPAAALSVKEFWGERWNRTVMAVLREHCLRPLAKRGYVRLGLLAAFVASAVLHAYLAIVSVGIVMALVTFAYFVVQGVAVLFEIAIRVDKRTRFVRRVWTLAFMIATSPLFVEPALRVIGL